MSMLAERKRKQKWSLNPRGNAWAQDTNKFGQKLLESMGWKEGKGLGARENGLKEHIKVSYKNDSKGFGFKDKDVWTEHEDNFSALLQDLSNSEVAFKIKTGTDEYKPKSLEEKSLTSRVRVHYHKFTRGKDLSRYSEKDLANVFGKRSLKEKKEEQEEGVGNGKVNDNNGVITVEGGSMIDYFKSKMSALYKNSEVKEDEDVRPGFGFSSPKNGKNANCSFSFESENDSLQNLEETAEEKKEKDKGKKKSKKRKLSEISDEATPKKKKNEATRDHLGTENLSNSTKKKKQKEKNESGDDFGLCNPAFDPLFAKEIEAAGDHLETENLSNSTKKKKQKEKNETGGDFGLSNPAFDPLFAKKIPVKRHSLNTINEVEEVEESPSNSFNERKKRKLGNSLEDEEHRSPKKKDKKKEETAVFEELVETKNNNTYEVKNKKKKSKDKKDIGIENPAFNSKEQVEDTGVVNPVFEDRKPKKKGKKNKEKNDLFEINSKVLEESHRNDDLIDETFQKELAHGFENPVFESPKNPEAMDNNVYEVKKKTKTKKTKKTSKNGIDNPTFEEKGTKMSEENPQIEESITTSSEIILNVSDEPDMMLNVSLGPPEYLKQTENDYSIRNVSNRRDWVNDRNNRRFDFRRNRFENERQIMSRKMDNFQAKIENNINESKNAFDINTFIGEPVTDGDHEKLEHGTKLKLKHAEFNAKTPFYLKPNNKPGNIAKKSYKHLIKGDIIVHFKNTNLHEIHGYGKTLQKVKNE